jgi:hypothetical protein
MLRERQTVNQGAFSPQEMHCHQYLAIGFGYLTKANVERGTGPTSDPSG